MYVVLTTYPEHGSGNVGDKLITESLKSIVEDVKGSTEFRVFFFEERIYQKN
jgi:hypothetical protein